MYMFVQAHVQVHLHMHLPVLSLAAQVRFFLHRYHFAQQPYFPFSISEELMCLPLRAQHLQKIITDISIIFLIYRLSKCDTC